MKLAIENIAAVLPHGLREGCGVYIDGRDIVAVGARPEGFAAQRTINGSGKLLIPGLVNCHTHAYMSVFRNYADDLSFSRWLFERIMPLEEKLTDVDCYWTTLLAIMEMLSTGTTCFLDMYIFPDSVTRAVADCGMRAVLSRGLTGGTEDFDAGQRRIREALYDIGQYKNNERISFMLAPHAPYTCDEGYQREIAGMAKERNLGIHTHLAESVRECEDIFERYGCTPAELLERNGLLTEKTVAAHCVQLSLEDARILKRNGVSVATNPVSNLKLANGIAPVPMLADQGINICIGTDGAASNNALNMIREMGYTALLHKGVSGDPESISAGETLKMATENGAAALEIGHMTGKIMEGMRADLTIINLDLPNMRPKNDPMAALVYSAGGRETETVMVNGEILYDRGEFLTIDADRVYDEVERVCKKIGMR